MSRGLFLFLVVLALLPTSVGAAGEIWFDPVFDGHAYSRSRVEPKIRAPTEVAKSLNRVYLDPYFEGTANAKLRADVRLSGSMPATVVEASRNVTPSNLAKAARIAARLAGPVLLVEAGLWTYEQLADGSESDGLLWTPEDGWQGAGQDAPFAWDYQSGYWFTSSVATCTSSGAACSFGQMIAERNSVDLGPNITETVVNVTNVTTNSATLHIFRERTDGYPNANFTVIANRVNNGFCPSGWTAQGTVCISPAAPATDQDIEDAIFHRLLAQEKGPDLAKRLIQAGHNPDFDPTQVSGPSSVPGETTTSTSTGPNGEVTTTTTNTYNFNYEGDTVTI
ncbi:MAG TPA: hypothetical protein PK205_16825, partial [Promineifilum sp.]|nr:hypothetical protein [Promineifilum sp.]